MTKNDYIVRAKAFIRTLNNYIDKDEITNYKRICETVRIFNMKMHRKVMTAIGATRIALVTADYCIKIDHCKTKWGNCKTEMTGYWWAVEHGVNEIFCPVTKYNYLGVEYYIYPRCTRTDDETVNLDSIYNRVGSDKYYFILDYFDDLHSNNIGMLHGKPVIIDYAYNCVS